MSLVESITAYFRSSKAELEKVSWPTKNDTVRYSVIIVAISIGMALFFAALDAGLQKGTSFLIEHRSQNAAPTTQEVPVATTTIPTTTTSTTSSAQAVPAVEAVTTSGTPTNIEVTPLPINAPSKK